MCFVINYVIFIERHFDLSSFLFAIIADVFKIVFPKGCLKVFRDFLFNRVENDFPIIPDRPIPMSRLITLNSISGINIGIFIVPIEQPDAIIGRALENSKKPLDTS